MRARRVNVEIPYLLQFLICVASVLADADADLAGAPRYVIMTAGSGRAALRDEGGSRNRGEGADANRDGVAR